MTTRLALLVVLSIEPLQICFLRTCLRHILSNVDYSRLERGMLYLTTPSAPEHRLILFYVRPPPLLTPQNAAITDDESPDPISVDSDVYYLYALFPYYPWVYLAHPSLLQSNARNNSRRINQVILRLPPTSPCRC